MDQGPSLAERQDKGGDQDRAGGFNPSVSVEQASVGCTVAMGQGKAVGQRWGTWEQDMTQASHFPGIPEHLP